MIMQISAVKCILICENKIWNVPNAKLRYVSQRDQKTPGGISAQTPESISCTSISGPYFWGYSDNT